MRVSNFLLWQIAYSEFVCTDVLWPDFDRYEFLRALLEFQSRDRRFGAVKNGGSRRSVDEAALSAEETARAAGRHAKDVKR